MAIHKITEQEMDANGVCAAPDILNGTPAENKAVFDRMIRQVVAPAYNACAEAVDQVEARVPEWEAAEQARQEAEVQRETAENARVLAEEKRAAAEQERQTAEVQRETAETQRKDAEIKREDKETGYIAQAKHWAEEAQKAAGGGVTSFNGRSGTVNPEKGDYTPEMVGAAPESETTKAQETANQALETANQAQQDANKVLVDASASEETKKLYGLGAGATNDDLFRVIRNFKWRKVKEFKSAGAYSWTPDHDGVYGFFVIGAGGSGAVGGQDTNVCTGGASGHTKTFMKTLSRGTQVNLTIGKGGAQETMAGFNRRSGQNGGSTSCLGVVAEGGEGGRASYDTTIGAAGGQGTDAGTNFPSGCPGLFGGVTLLYPTGAAYFAIACETPMECWNFFEGIPVLGSGANTGCYSSYNDGDTTVKGGKNVDGLGGGDARFSLNSSVIGESASLPGCGGGAAVVKNASSSKTATSGAGADGAVIIYEGSLVQ